MKATVDRKKCTVCGVCTDACPMGAISLRENQVEISDDCSLCGICVDTCEFGALSLPEVGKGPAEDLRSYRGVWVYAEWREGKVHKVSHELLSVGRILADKRGVRTWGRFARLQGLTDDSGRRAHLLWRRSGLCGRPPGARPFYRRTVFQMHCRTGEAQSSRNPSCRRHQHGALFYSRV